VTSAPDTPAEVRAHPTRTLLVLALGALAYTLAQTMVVPALPEIQRHYGVDASDSTWVFTVFLVTSCVCTPILGRLGDMYGKERLLLISLGVFAAGNLVSGTAQSLEVLILGRASSATSSRASGWPAGSARSRPCSGSAAAWGSSCPAC
jgi:predicted MFS family arabinose efflux permease